MLKKGFWGGNQGKGFIGLVNSLAYRWVTREKVIHPGNANDDIVFYVIRGVDSKSKFYQGVDLNLLANYSYVLSHLLYAESRRLTPIVDQKNYPVYNKEDFCINGVDNPWEYFWQQPSSYTLNDVYNSKNVVLSKRNWYAKGNPGYSISAHTTSDSISKFHRLMEKVPLNSRTQLYVDKNVSIVFPQSAYVVGVNARGGGYSKSSPWQAPRHPVQPNIESLINITQKRMKTREIIDKSDSLIIIRFKKRALVYDCVERVPSRS